MFIMCSSTMSADTIKQIEAEAMQAGFARTVVIEGNQVKCINCLGSVEHAKKLNLAEYVGSFPGVQAVKFATTAYRLTSREAHPEVFRVQLNGIAIGGNEPIAVIAGPCAIESADQINFCADQVKAAGVHILRGGAYKPRKSPYDFQGLEEEGLKLLAAAGKRTGLLTVTEVVSAELVPLVASYVDILQIGTNNMGNAYLLNAVGLAKKPVILKRNHAKSIDEWLLAAEYIVQTGNDRVILCARGVSGIANGHTRYNCDLDALVATKRLTHHPVIYDPSHNAGNREFVPDIANAAIAARADGVMIEVHPNPPSAKCDGPQSLYPDRFAALMSEMRAIAAAIGRTL